MAEVDELRSKLLEIRDQQLRIAAATDMTRPAMREAAAETAREIDAFIAAHTAAEHDALNIFKRILADPQEVRTGKFWNDVAATVAKAEGTAPQTAER